MCVDARYLGVCVAECVTLRDERVGALRLVIRAFVHLLLSCGRALLSASLRCAGGGARLVFASLPRFVCVLCVFCACISADSTKLLAPANYSPPSYSASKELLA